MAVNLSPYGGVGAQFLDNAGNVLTGGKIFTYAGGTTTPQATYTSSNGGTPHPNPIILDAAGRVPGGEIWLTDGLVYKFILRDANDVLIATYDGLSGINSNFVAFTNQQEIQTATAGQTVFNLTTMSYQPGTNSLSVFVDGVNQYGPGAQYAYLETDSDTVTFLSGLHVGAEVKFTTSQLNTSGSTNDAFQVSYVPPFNNSVATNVGVKLSETVSVKDFGAVGDGVADDTAAIQAAVTAAKNIIVPTGTYKITADINLSSNQTIECQANVVFDVSSAPTGTIVFYGTGSFGSTYLLTADANVGATTLTLTSGDAANFAVDDWIQIYSNTIYDPGYAATKIGEMVQIASVSSGTITLKSPLAGGNYTTAESAVIRKATFIENTSVIGGQFIGSSTSTVLHVAVRFDVAYNCSIYKSHAKFCNGNSFNIRDSLFCIASDIYVEDALATTGYGINWTGTCQDCKTVNSVFVRCRHAVTNTSAGIGICRRLSYENCTSYESINNGDAFDTHSNAEDVAFVNCVSYDASANGFNIECGTATLTACKAIRSNRSGIVFATNITLTPNRFTAVGCVVDTTTQFYGFNIGNGGTSTNTATEQISIVGCSVFNTAQEAIIAQGDSGYEIQGLEVTGGQFQGNDVAKQFYIGAFVSKFRVSNTHVKAPNTSGAAMLLEDCSYGSIDNCILEFTTQGSGLCINITDSNNISVSNCTGVQVNPARGTGIQLNGTTSKIYIAPNNNFQDCTAPGVSEASLTIASGVITIPNSSVGVCIIDTEGGAATDDLDTINGGFTGQITVLTPASSVRDITVKDATGNLRLNGDFVFTQVQDTLTLMCKENGSLWFELSRSSN